MLTLPILLKKLEELEGQLGVDVSIAMWVDGSGAVWKNVDTGNEMVFEFDDLTHLDTQLKEML